MQTLNTKEANLSGRPRTQPALRLKLAIGAEAGHVAQVLPPGGLLVKDAGTAPLELDDPLGSATKGQPLPAVLIAIVELQKFKVIGHAKICSPSKVGRCAEISSPSKFRNPH